MSLSRLPEILKLYLHSFSSLSLSFAIQEKARESGSRIIQRDWTLVVVSRTGRQRIPSLESGFYYPVTRCVKAASDLTISRDLISSPACNKASCFAAFVDKNLPCLLSLPTQPRFQPRFRDENRPVDPVPGCGKSGIDIRNRYWSTLVTNLRIVDNRPSNLRVFSSDRFEYWKAYMVFKIDFQTMIFEHRSFLFFLLITIVVTYDEYRLRTFVSNCCLGEI